MNEPEFDPQLLEWLREGSSQASDRVLEAADLHARAHPRRRSLGVRWGGALNAMPLGSATAPVFHLALIAGAAALGLMAGGLLYAGSHGLFDGPTPTPSATPSPATSPSDASRVPPDVVIDDMLEAWRRNDMAAIPSLYASDHTDHFIGDPSGLPGGSRHFEIAPEAHGGWVYWERRGIIFHQGAYWAHATVAGVWDPPSRGFVVYRFSPDDRIAVQWVLVDRLGSALDAAPATSARVKVTAILDECLAALDAGDGAAYSTCYAPDGAFRVSADGPGGVWTEEHLGSAAIGAGLARSAYADTERTGDVVLIGDMVAYPFRSSSTDCRAGIDVFQFDATVELIVNHWALCGPE
jgi:ketosteroid isomerase-like protein